MSQPVKVRKKNAKEQKAWEDVLPALEEICASLLPMYERIKSEEKRALLLTHNPTFAKIMQLAGRVK